MKRAHVNTGEHTACPKIGRSKCTQLQTLSSLSNTKELNLQKLINKVKKNIAFIL